METSKQQRGHALRKGRVSLAGQSYLLTAVTWRRRPLFTDIAIGRVVMHAMRYRAELGRVESLALVVMPDHLHWLVTLGPDQSLARLMQSMKGYSGYRIKQLTPALAPDEPAWQEGYHDHALRREEDLHAVAGYLLANPLRAGLVERLGDYPLWDTAWPEDLSL